MPLSQNQYVSRIIPLSPMVSMGVMPLPVKRMTKILNETLNKSIRLSELLGSAT